MARMKLKPCPFCGETLKDEFPVVDHYKDDRGGQVWQVCHYCAAPFGALGVTVTVYGVTKRQAVYRWNTRVDVEG